MHIVKVVNRCGDIILTYGARSLVILFFFQAEDGIRDLTVTGVQTCALPISGGAARGAGTVPRRPAPQRLAPHLRVVPEPLSPLADQARVSSSRLRNATAAGPSGVPKRRTISRSRVQRGPASRAATIRRSRAKTAGRDTSATPRPAATASRIASVLPSSIAGVSVTPSRAR